jgi:uncharacterized membrane protein
VQTSAALDAVALERPLAAERALPRQRLQSIDLLRGLVIALMVLDHTRDYFMSKHVQPLDLAHTTTALYFTRWITHYCAPSFVFLAGVSAQRMSERMSRAALSRLLSTRGLWLVLLEFTVVNFAWNFNVSYTLGLIMQVIWAIGMSMCALSALVWLPRWAIAALAALLIVGHNLLDPIQPEQFGAWAPLWQIIHVEGEAPFGIVLYPLVPWIGVMALGFVLGPLFDLPAPQRRSQLLRLGLGMCAAFVLLRLVNGYGEPRPWSPQANAWFTVLSFLDVTKYPPSLAYVLMTLGPALLLLAWFERLRGPLVDAIETFGRVPLFAYVLHLMLVHLAAGLTALALGTGSVVLTHIFLFYPDDWGFGLGVVYLVWLVVLTLMVPLCRWFAAVKRRRTDWWLSYL